MRRSLGRSADSLDRGHIDEVYDLHPWIGQLPARLYGARYGGCSGRGPAVTGGISRVAVFFPSSNSFPWGTKAHS